ncbi:MAG: helix-turn-helix domain-containing protein [Humidesulfovibrio sp.]|nr:helix-turn-helix domain-containing protein [Humidesulfovibrio sp.]
MSPKEHLDRVRAQLATLRGATRQISGVGWVCSIARHRLHTVALPQCAAVVVLEGRKLLFRGQERLETSAGQLLLIPAQVGLTVENIPDPASGRYTALVLEFEEKLLVRVAAATPTPDEPPSGDCECWRVPLDAPLASSLAHLLDMGLVSVGGERVLSLCREELLTLLSERSGFLPRFWPASTSWRARCAALLGADPGREWPAVEVASRLGVSERNLRRNLSAEGVGLRTLLRDVRLNTALGLLQSGRLNVGEAAFRCGYASPSRFAVRFRQRFGMRPSDLLRQNAEVG